MILLLNGAFGIGKSTVARLIVARLPRAILFDPEIAGITLQRMAPLVGRRVDDFQDLRLWRRFTIAGLRATRLVWPNVVVPMAFSDHGYLQEIVAGIRRFEPRVVHYCLVAPVEVVHERLRGRGEDPAKAEWQYRRASECCRVHEREEFATQVAAGDRNPNDVADGILGAIR